MKFDLKFCLKWLEVKNWPFADSEVVVTGYGLLYAVGADKQIVGLTVFESRELGDAFLEKLKIRMSRPEFAGKQFVLAIPAFLKHRAEALIKKYEMMNLKIVYSSFACFQVQSGKIQIRHQLRVFSVDDSPVLLKFLKHTMAELEFIEVIGQCSDPKKAADEICRAKPDVVTMDIQMPGKTGVEVVRELLAKQYFPVLMISSVSLDEGTLVFDALNSGAFDYLQKPKLEEKEDFKNELLSKFLLAVEGKGAHSALKKAPNVQKNNTPKSFNFADNLLWVIGSSTGGTQALTRVFTSMPTEIPPTLIVQHIPPIFSKAFADSLNNLCPFTVKEAVHGEQVLPNHVYIAAGGLQMGVEQRMGKIFIAVRDDAPVNRFKPSVDYLFKEVAQLKGMRVVASVLTGMGKDGSVGLLELMKTGAYTFAQDEESSAVYGMPRACAENGSAQKIVPLDGISDVFLTQSTTYKKAL
jgi:two-component system chemotaxis response regulator CheB